MIPDLRNTKVLVVVWAMPGCGACDEYLPMFLERVAAFQKAGAPFHVWSPGQPIKNGEIPVLLYDAASDNEELQNFADKLKITATPTTCVLLRYGSTKLEGSIPQADVDQVLEAAQRANR